MDPLLTKDDAAKVCSVSRRTIDRAIAARELQAVKIGQLIRIERPALAAWIASNRTAPPVEAPA